MKKVLLCGVDVSSKELVVAIDPAQCSLIDYDVIAIGPKTYRWQAISCDIKPMRCELQVVGNLARKVADRMCDRRVKSRMKLTTGSQSAR